GCQAPIAAVGEVDGPVLVLRGLVAGPGGLPLLKERLEGTVAGAEALGLALAEALLARGAGSFLQAPAAPAPEAP
ncbi:MAG: hydroxymethylbilane synthase, partial [Acidobacteria bacterium]|nr:hydroxymethylbilane synthase [Acidobacteriota bacterium]